MLAFLQWVVFACTAGIFYFVGSQAFHIRNFGFFAGGMVITAALVVAAVVALERRKLGSKEKNGSR